jgi:hypothetical protein
MFGDNASVIASSIIPQFTLTKQHNTLSYHYVGESIAAKILHLVHVEGRVHPGDICTKALGWFNFGC